MRNKYPGICYKCNNVVAAGDGHFERYNGGWRVQHAKCVKNRMEFTNVGFQKKKHSNDGNPDPTRFEVLSETTTKNYTVVVVNYPDAKNFEGNKVMVLEGTQSVKTAKELDPHFDVNSRVLARFRPNAEGIGMSIKFALDLDKQVKKAQ